jgi:CRP-like cAMP-binding protein
MESFSPFHIHGPAEDGQIKPWTTMKSQRKIHLAAHAIADQLHSSHSPVQQMIDVVDKKPLFVVEKKKTFAKPTRQVPGATPDLFPDWLTARPDFTAMYTHGAQGNIEAWLQATHTRPSQRTEKQLELLAQHFKQSGLFAHLGLIPEHLARAVYFQTCTDIGSVLCKPGESGACYYIVKGSAEVVSLVDENFERVLLRKGQSFGPMSETKVEGADLAEVINRSCPTEVLLVNVLDFNASLLKESIKLLATIEMFVGWSRARLTKLAHVTKNCVFEAGDIVVREGAVIDGVYIVKSGRLAVQKDVHVIRRNRWPRGGAPPSWEVLESHSDRALNISSIKSGGVFGEFASFEKNWRQAKRTATVRAMVKSQLLYVPQKNFHHFMMTSNGLVDYLMATQEDYLKADRRQAERIKKEFVMNEETDTVLFVEEREAYVNMEKSLLPEAEGGVAPPIRARLMSIDERYGKHRPSSAVTRRLVENMSINIGGGNRTMSNTFISSKPKMKYRADSLVVAMLHEKEMPRLRQKLRAKRKKMGRTAAWAHKRDSPYAAHFTV